MVLRRIAAVPAVFQRGIGGLYRADLVLQVSDAELKRSQRIPADPIHRVTLVCVEERFRCRLLVPGGQEHRQPGSIVPILPLIEQNGDEFVDGETAAFTCCDPSLYGRHSIAAASDGLAGHFTHNADLPSSHSLTAACEKPHSTSALFLQDSRRGTLTELTTLCGLRLWSNHRERHAGKGFRKVVCSPEYDRSEEPYSVSVG